MQTKQRENLWTAIPTVNSSCTFNKKLGIIYSALVQCLIRWNKNMLPCICFNIKVTKIKRSAFFGTPGNKRMYGWLRWVSPLELSFGNYFLLEQFSLWRIYRWSNCRWGYCYLGSNCLWSICRWSNYLRSNNRRRYCRRSIYRSPEQLSPEHLSSE